GRPNPPRALAGGEGEPLKPCDPIRSFARVPSRERVPGPHSPLLLATICRTVRRDQGVLVGDYRALPLTTRRDRSGSAALVASAARYGMCSPAGSAGRSRGFLPTDARHAR